MPPKWWRCDSSLAAMRFSSETHLNLCGSIGWNHHCYWCYCWTLHVVGFTLSPHLVGGLEHVLFFHISPHHTTIGNHDARAVLVWWGCSACVMRWGCSACVMRVHERYCPTPPHPKTLKGYCVADEGKMVSQLRENWGVLVSHLREIWCHNWGLTWVICSASFRSPQLRYMCTILPRDKRPIASHVRFFWGYIPMMVSYHNVYCWLLKVRFWVESLSMLIQQWIW